MTSTEPPSAKTSSPPRARRKLPMRQALSLLAPIVGAILASIVAFQQAPRADSGGPSGFWDWFWKPMEWNARASVVRLTPELRDLCAVPGTTEVWICGTGGFIAHSGNEGRTWESFEVPLFDPAAMAEKGALEGSGPVAPGDDAGAPLFGEAPLLAEDRRPDRVRPLTEATPPGTAAATPAKVTKPPAAQRPNFNSIHFYDSTHGWAVGDKGAAYRYNAGWRRWEAVSPPGDWDLKSVRMEEEDFVHVIARQPSGATDALSGANRLLSFTGTRWQVGHEFPALGAILPPRTGLAAAGRPSLEYLQATEARGKVSTTALSYLFCVDDDHGWGTLPGAGLMALGKGATQAWAADVPFAQESLRNLCVVGAKLGWVVGGQDLYASTDGLRRWARICPLGPDWSKVVFRDAVTGWLIAGKGAIALTRDGGRSWVPVAFYARLPDWEPSKVGLPLLTSHPAGSVPGENYYDIVRPGLDDSFLATKATARWQLFPAPWYFLSLVLLGLVCKTTLTPPPTDAKDEQIESLFQPDAPLTPGQPDAMQFGSLAAGISHFLRNESTAPPLTLAVVGEWGSGKSSLMNLLRADLERRGFRPVWFNPWHHQKEEHLLAALLENVIEQALPTVWSIDGLTYRARLVAARVRKRWALWALMCLVLAGGVSYVTHLNGSERRREWEVAKWAGRAVIQQFREVVKRPEAEKQEKGAKAEEEKPKAEPAPAEPSGSEGKEDDLPGRGLPATLVVAISALGSLVGLLKMLSSFGVNPGSLLAQESKRAKLDDLRAQTGFRYRFMREFKEVTEALNPRTMLILIDDLDRCQPGAVVETLEAVNFLVSSGDCFVVIGMAKERVEGCIRAAFKKDGDVLFKKGETIEEFARNYIEKLINIIVPIPQVTAQQACAILAAKPDAGDERRKQARALLREIVGTAASIGLMALLAGMLWWAFGFGKNEAAKVNARTEAQAAAAPEVMAPANTSVTKSDVTARPIPPTPPPTVEKGEAPQAELVATKPTSWTRWMGWLAPAVVFSFGIWRLFFRPAVVTHDSPAYLEALRTWQPLIGARGGTPRALKRFLNHLRFLDSRQRGLKESETSMASMRLERARAWLLARPWLPEFGRDLLTPEALPPQGAREIDATILVGMAAARYAIADWKSGAELPAMPPAELKIEKQVWHSLRELSLAWASHAGAFDRLSRVVCFS